MNARVFGLALLLVEASASGRNDLLNASVNSFYRDSGLSNLKASPAAERLLEKDGLKGISARELKVGLEDGLVVLSLRGHSAAAEAAALALDKADGKEDGSIDLTRMGDVFEGIEGSSEARRPSSATASRPRSRPVSSWSARARARRPRHPSTACRSWKWKGTSSRFGNDTGPPVGDGTSRA